MSMHISTIAAIGLLALPCVSSAQSAPASKSAFQRLWYQAYDEGVRAALKGDWATAIAALEAAKRGGPAAGRRVLFQGDRVDVFNPDYYLGLAYNASKRFGEAEAAFARVANDNLIMPGDRQFDELRKQLSVAKFERVIADGERALRAGRYTDVEKLLASVVGSTADDGRAGDLAKRAKDEGAKAAYGNVVDVAQRPPASNAPADRPGAPVLQTSDPKLAANDLPKAPVTPAPATKDPVPVSTTTLANRPPSPIDKNPIESGKANVSLSNPVKQEPRPAVPLGDAEAALQGATAYFQGNYEEAVRILTPAFNAFPPAHTVTFYLACSKAALVASGRADRSTLNEAREMFANARGDELSPHLRYISPRIREMLGDVRPTEPTALNAK